MRKRIKPLALLLFFAFFILYIVISKHQLDLQNRQAQTKKSQVSQVTTKKKKEEAPSDEPEEELLNKPIVDLSGWQLPSEIDYDTLSTNISGAIIRVHSGAQAKKENVATHLNGLDKSFATHIQEFQKRGVRVAVYAYIAAGNIKEMEKEAESFYKASSKYKPTFYWLDVEEKTMGDMNAGIEAFRAKLESLGAQNIGIYIGTYFMEEHSISTEKFTAVWIPTYGYNDGYYNAAPNTEQPYDLHQYTSEGKLEGFPHNLDLNQLSPVQDKKETYKKLFSTPK